MTKSVLAAADGILEYGGKCFYFSEQAIKRLHTHFSKVGFSKESGGVILGSKAKDSEDYYIVGFTLPSKYDKAGQAHFERNAKISNRRIAKAWQDSGGKVNYIGEWHSHNQRVPYPSSVDISLIDGVSGDPKSCPFGFMLMMIVGNQGMACFVCAEQGGHHVPDATRFSLWNQQYLEKTV